MKNKKNIIISLFLFCLTFLFITCINTKTYAAVLEDHSIVIEAPTFIINADEPLTFDAISSEITAVDPSEGDITDKLVFSENSYSLREDGKCTPGLYSFVATVSDSSSNITSQRFDIYAIDIVAPIITVPNNYQLNPSTAITIETLKSLISVVDSIDGTITDYTLEDVDNYFSNTSTSGFYTFIVSAIDSSGNSNIKSFEIQVLDNDDPEIHWDGTYVISVEQGAKFTKEEIIVFLESINVSRYDVSSIESSYFTEDTVGEHDLKIILNDGLTITHKLSVFSKMSSEGDDNIITPEPPTDDDIIEVVPTPNPVEYEGFFEKINEVINKYIEPEALQIFKIIGGIMGTIITIVIIYWIIKKLRNK